MKYLFFALTVCSFTFSDLASADELSKLTPQSLPYVTRDGGEVACVGDFLVYRSESKTVSLASACPKEFIGEGAGGLYATFEDGTYLLDFKGGQTQLAPVSPVSANCLINDKLVSTFGNGLYLIDKTGKQTLLASVAAKTFYGCHPTQGVLAGFGNGLYLLKYDNTRVLLASTDAETLHGVVGSGLVAQFADGLYYSKWTGERVRLSEARPRSVVSVGEQGIRACYGNGLYEIDYAGKLKVVAPTC